MSTSDDYLVKLLPNIAIHLFRYGAVVLCLIGNIGHLLTIWIFLQRPWRKNVCALYFLTCSISNLLYIDSALLGTILINGYSVSIQNSVNILCKLYFYVSYVFAFYYPAILILASIDRLLISSQNVDTRLYSSKRLAYFSIGICTCVCSIFSVHILVNTAVQNISATYTVCSYDLSKIYQDFFSYSNLVIVLLNYTLMITLSILAFKNVRCIRVTPQQQRHQLRTMTKKDFQLLRSLYAHNIIYIIFSSVLVTSSLYSTILRDRTPTIFEQVLNRFLSQLANFTNGIPRSSSFFVFICISKAFRQALIRSVTRGRRRDARINRNNIEMNNVNAVVVVVSC